MNSRLFFWSAIFLFLLSSKLYATLDNESWLYNQQGIFKAGQGNHKEAIKDFEAACRMDPFNDSALTNLAFTHNNLGVILAEQKKYYEAIEHFNAAKAQKPEDISIRLNLLSTLVTIKDIDSLTREAEEILKLRPRDAEITLKVAAAYQNSEKTISAQTTLEKLIDLVPDNPEVNATLGRLLYKNGNIDDAIFYLKRAKDLFKQSRPDVENFLKQLQKENAVIISARHYSSLHFSLTCHESFSEGWAEELLDLLEEAYQSIGDRLSFYPSQRSQVLVMQTNDFHKVHDLPEWAGGVYDGKIRLPVPSRATLPSSLRSAIRHEYTHHVVFLMSSGNCPLWLNEGLAQIFEFNSNPDESVEEFIKIDIQLKDFANQIRKSKQEAGNLYRQAHITVLKIIRHIGWPAMSELLHSLGKGYSVEEVLKQAQR
jgi:tetratricopeptide (TPR) repeat protein